MCQDRENPIEGGRQIYDLENLPEDGKLIVAKMRFVELKLRELENQHALLTKAKNAYIADLRGEIVQGRSGINLGELFSED
jgi:hypothetical protein